MYPEPAFSLVLHKELLFSSDSPILDVVLDADAKHAYALGVQEISSYEWQGGMGADWSRASACSWVARARRTGFVFRRIGRRRSRVLARGTLPDFFLGWKRVELREDNRACSSEGGISCCARRKEAGAWISAAQFETDGKMKIVVTGQDGLARLYEEGAEPVAVFPNWGSEIASVYSGCGSGWQVLVTGNGDWTTSDAIQAIDLKDRRAQSVSAAMEFAGPIVALHTPATRTADNAAANSRAVAVARNLQTGWYEAYQLSISCSR